MANPAVIMTIAGSDSGGGAGIQADLKTMTVLGAFGISAITALTAQNGEGVRGIHAPDPDFMRTQLETLLDGFPIAAAKTGMLFSAPLMEVVAACLAGKTFPLVVDPVAVSQSGHKLLRDDAVEALIRTIIPLADVITPNAPEAEALTGKRLRYAADIAVLAEDLMAKGAKAVLLKGGHFAPEDMPSDGIMTDWLCLPGKAPKALPHKLIETKNNHGTGCTLSAAMATFLGQGKPLEEAVVLAQKYLVAGLAASYTPGVGCGPPNFPAGAAALKCFE
ncbi:Phosphomethylpyrimidine kinase [uncultured delta proteobacterium]|uniref:hydroxymethylpyrimidine kinase n=1 Tax=uncultured delta proteobacterium TaxID=34034 RepID=A0A212J669_9DELT|nr:Phosphomethylpyrimidine kinase [uncultured delta proteobacterium]